MSEHTNSTGGLDHTVEELYEQDLAELHEDWHHVFTELTAQGKRPSTINATIEYVTTPKTQLQVSRESGVSVTTIRQLKPAVLALGPISEEDRTNSHNPKTIQDYCNDIADELGWEEDNQYTYHDHHQISLNKAGWRSLFELIVSDSEGS